LNQKCLIIEELDKIIKDYSIVDYKTNKLDIERLNCIISDYDYSNHIEHLNKLKSLRSNYEYLVKLQASMNKKMYILSIKDKQFEII
jgi:hypothetical protein